MPERLKRTSVKSNTAEETGEPAGQHIHADAQTEGSAAGIYLLETKILLAFLINLPVIFDLFPNQLILLVVRIHAAGLIDLLKTKNPIA